MRRQLLAQNTPIKNYTQLTNAGCIPRPSKRNSVKLPLLAAATPPTERE